MFLCVTLIKWKNAFTCVLCCVSFDNINKDSTYVHLSYCIIKWYANFKGYIQHLFNYQIYATFFHLLFLDPSKMKIFLGLGGLMGLFIGLSFLSIILMVYEGLEKLVILLCCRQEIEDTDVQPFHITK